MFMPRLLLLLPLLLLLILLLPLHRRTRRSLSYLANREQYFNEPPFKTDSIEDKPKYGHLWLRKSRRFSPGITPQVQRASNWDCGRIGEGERQVWSCWYARQVKSEEISSRFLIEEWSSSGTSDLRRCPLLTTSRYFLRVSVTLSIHSGKIFLPPSTSRRRAAFLATFVSSAVPRLLR